MSAVRRRGWCSSKSMSRGPTSQGRFGGKACLPHVVELPKFMEKMMFKAGKAGECHGDLRFVAVSVGMAPGVVPGRG